ncbi:organic cation transporter protein-like [Maniola jurtina]|uniref:organic cation transporter protein-like n=1 Tax=Maniola jurtina TaxID=191418 RepID=UPI001E68828F|nr:organic cation transporter protein-like [Maniola jurtina]
MTKVKNPKLQNPIEKHFNEITRYHYYFYFLIFTSKIPIFWHVLSLIFLSPPVDYHCNVTGVKNVNSTKNVCPCDEPLWDRSMFSETMQTKFGLYCARIWLISFSQSMMYVGLLVGALVFGFLSDRYGRRSMFSMSCLILAVSGCLVSAMPTAAAYTLMRSIEGIGTGGAIITSYVFCIEYTGVRHREIVTALFHIPLNISHLTLPGISYLLRHCDEFQLALSIPVFFYIGMQWMVMESPKWLMDSDRIDESVVVMEKFASFIGTSRENIRNQIKEYHANHSPKARRRIKIWHVFCHKKLGLNFFYMSVIYFLCGMGYYGVSQYIGKMSGDIHVNVAISGAMLLPGTIAAVFLLKLLNRRTFLMSTIFLSGLFMIIVICVPFHYNWGRVLIACICNCFFFVSFIIVFLFGVELFPTSIRNSVLGILSVISRVGQITAPSINALSENASGAVFGVLALVGTLFCFLLPETKDTELPSSLDDTKILTRGKPQLVEDGQVMQNIATSSTE